MAKKATKKTTAKKATAKKSTSKAQKASMKSTVESALTKVKSQAAAIEKNIVSKAEGVLHDAQETLSNLADKFSEGYQENVKPVVEELLPSNDKKN